MNICGIEIGDQHPTFVIAELSANHNGSLDDAIALMETAKASGADAIKIQTYKADTITLKSNRPEFQINSGTMWDGRNLYDLYDEAHTPWDWHEALFSKASDLGVPLFSTPFDDTAVELLETFEPPAYKIASFELIDHGLLRTVARTGKPIIMSTGMATLGEIEEAVSVIREEGCESLCLLKCTSSYPAPIEEANLRTISHLAETFGVVAGLSDHTLTEVVPIGAVAIGARVIEKHLTQSRDLPGPDSAFSIEPAEFRSMVDGIRTVEAALGGVDYSLTDGEKASVRYRRSLFVSAGMKKGDKFSASNVKSVRPGHGLPPKFLPEIIGKTAVADYEVGTPLSWEMISDS